MLEGHLPVTDKDLATRSISTKNPPLPNFCSSETVNNEKYIAVKVKNISDKAVEICIKRKEGVIDLAYYELGNTVPYEHKEGENLIHLRVVNRLEVDEEVRYSLSYFNPYYWIKYCYDNAVAFPVVYFDMLVREFVENDKYREYLVKKLIELEKDSSDLDMSYYLKFYNKVIEKALWFKEQEDHRVMITLK